MGLIQLSNRHPGMTKEQCSAACADLGRDGCCNWHDKACYFYPDGTPTEEGNMFGLLSRPFVNWNVELRESVAAARCEAPTDNVAGVPRANRCEPGEYVDTQCTMNGLRNQGKSGNNYCCVKCPNKLPNAKQWIQLSAGQYHVPDAPNCKKRPSWQSCDDISCRKASLDTMKSECLTDPACDGFTYDEKTTDGCFKKNCADDVSSKFFTCDNAGCTYRKWTEGSKCKQLSCKDDVSAALGTVKCILDPKCNAFLLTSSDQGCYKKCTGSDIVDDLGLTPPPASPLETYVCENNVPMSTPEIFRMCQWRNAV